MQGPTYYLSYKIRKLSLLLSATTSESNNDSSQRFSKDEKTTAMFISLIVFIIFNFVHVDKRKKNNCKLQKMCSPFTLMMMMCSALASFRFSDRLVHNNKRVRGVCLFPGTPLTFNKLMYILHNNLCLKVSNVRF